MRPHGRDAPTSCLPAGATVVGGLEAAQDVTIEGRFDGHLTLPDHHLSIGPVAVVSARIVARSVTIAGSVDGNILARERVDLLAGAVVRGHLTTPAITLEDGAQFTGSVDPHRTEAALHVARYRQRRS